MTCTDCGGEIGPDITGRLMCYGECADGFLEMLPREARVARMERRYRAAMSEVQADLSAAIFGPVHEGPVEPPPPWRVRARRAVSRWWLDVREWIAAKVLRVELAADVESDW